VGTRCAAISSRGVREGARGPRRAHAAGYLLQSQGPRKVSPERVSAPTLLCSTQPPAQGTAQQELHPDRAAASLALRTERRRSQRNCDPTPPAPSSTGCPPTNGSQIAPAYQRLAAALRTATQTNPAFLPPPPYAWLSTEQRHRHLCQGPGIWEPGQRIPGHRQTSLLVTGFPPFSSKTHS